MRSGPHPRQRNIDLLCGVLLGAAVDLGHKEHTVAVAALVERRADAQLRPAIVVVPAIVDEIDPAVDALVHQSHGLIVAHRILAEVETAHADGGNHLAVPAERAVQHFAPPLARVGDKGQRRRV